MSVRTDQVNLIVNINGNTAQNQLNDLRKKAADLKGEMQGLNKSTQEYKDKALQLKQVGGEMDSLKKKIGLASLSQKELNAELSKLKSLKGSVVPFSKEFNDLETQIKSVQLRIAEVRNGTQGFASTISTTGEKMKQFGAIASAYFGFQFIASQFNNIIQGSAKLSDELADLQRVAAFTADEAKNLNNQLGTLDTRTSTAGLREIAIIAGKLGVAKEDIFGFTKAVDQLVVSLGDELGNAGDITDKLGKILNVFDGKVTGENISQLGNAFVELANTGAASGGFIAEFDQRLASIAKSSDIGLGALSGLGAGIEELGGKVESSSSGVQNLIVKVAGDLPAAAKVAGKTADEFKKLFAANPTEALLQYSEGLVKNKSNFAEVTASLKDAGEEGVRTVSIISTLGKNADLLRGRIELGTKAIKDNSAITEAFNLKNETFGATLDKLGKEFEKIGSSQGLSNFFKGAVEGVISFIRAIKTLPQFIADNRIALLTLTAGIILMNKQYVVSASVTIRDSIAKAYNATVTRLTASASGIAAAAQGAYIVITNLLTGRITIATAAQRLYNLTLSFGAGAIGAFIAIASGLVIVLSSVLGKTKELTASQQAQLDIQAKISELSVEEETRAKSLFNTLTKSNLGYEEKKKLLAELIAINPQYLSGLTLENIKTEEGTKILGNYISKLREANQAKAREQVIADKERKRQDLENKINDSYTVTKDDKGNVISKELRNKDNSLAGAVKSIFSDNEVAALNKQEEELKKVNSELDSLYSDLGVSIEKTVEGGNKTNDGLKTQIGLIKKLQDEIALLDKARPDLTSEKAISNNLVQRKKLQDELDRLEGKQAKISPAEKKDKTDRERLKKEYEQFLNELQKLKEKAQVKGEAPEQAEIDAITNKYNELFSKAENYFIKLHTATAEANAVEKSLAEAQLQEILNIRKKYFEKGSEDNYKESLQEVADFLEQQKQQYANAYAEQKLNDKEYQEALTALDQTGFEMRLKTAKNYSAYSKNAKADENKFQLALEAYLTGQTIEQVKKRREIADRDSKAKAEREVITTKKGTDARFEAEKNRLKTLHDIEMQNADLTNEERLLKEAEYNEAVKQLGLDRAKEIIAQVETYVGFFSQAISSINQISNNRENADLAKDKKANDEKKKNYKKQLDLKLISKEQYDLKVAAADEELDKKDKIIKRRQAEREKALNIFQAIVNTASAIAEALPNVPLSIIAGVLGGFQIAAIANAPLPELARGKWFQEGKKHSEGGIPVEIERDEAVITGRAMTNQKKYTVTGTTAQITSALNSIGGGVNWAGGAIVNMTPWLSAPTPRINPNLPRIMEQGGIVRPITNSNNSNDDEMKELMRQFIQQQKLNIEEIKNMKTKLHAVVSIKEYQEQERQYDAAKKASGF